MSAPEVIVVSPTAASITLVCEAGDIMGVMLWQAGAWYAYTGPTSVDRGNFTSKEEAIAFIMANR
jgi:hypothetical protein